jgi:hypothetical protein
MKLHLCNSTLSKNLACTEIFLSIEFGVILSKCCRVCNDRSINQSEPINVSLSTRPGAHMDDGETYPPPIIDMTQAPGRITSECVSTTGRANPVTTMVDVMNRPRSTGPELLSYDANSSPPQWANTAFGRGANTKVRAAVPACELIPREGWVCCRTHQPREVAS